MHISQFGLTNPFGDLTSLILDFRRNNMSFIIRLEFLSPFIIQIILIQSFNLGFFNFSLFVLNISIYFTSHKDLNLVIIDTPFSIFKGTR